MEDLKKLKFQKLYLFVRLYYIQPQKSLNCNFFEVASKKLAYANLVKRNILWVANTQFVNECLSGIFERIF